MTTQSPQNHSTVIPSKPGKYSNTQSSHLVRVLHVPEGPAAVARRRRGLHVVHHQPVLLVMMVMVVQMQVILAGHASANAEGDPAVLGGGDHELDDPVMGRVHDALAVDGHDEVAGAEAAVEVGSAGRHYVPNRDLLAVSKVAHSGAKRKRGVEISRVSIVGLGLLWLKLRGRVMVLGKRTRLRGKTDDIFG